MARETDENLYRNDHDWKSIQTVKTAKMRGSREPERNLLALRLPTLDMYLPLSKFESIHRVSIALRCNNNLL